MAREIVLKNAQDALAFELTGGQAVTFVVDGSSIQNGIHLIDAVESNPLSRNGITFKSRPSTIDTKTGQMSKEKRYVSITKPRQLTSGAVVYSTLRIEVDYHPELSDGDIKDLFAYAMQVAHLDTSVMNSFWTRGVLPA